MASINELANELEQTFEALKWKGLYFGKIGKLQSDNSVTLQAGLSDKNLVWVTLNDQTREPIAALCVGKKKEINAPVIVGLNRNRRLEVLDIDLPAALDAFGEATPTLYAPDRVGEFVNEIVPNKNLLPRVYPAEAGGLNVTVSPFDWDGGWWPGGDLLMTVPATASKKAWCVVCLKTSDNTLAQITGTEYALAYTLTHTELAAVTITDAYIPLWGFVLQNGQTSITSATQNEPLEYRLIPKGGTAGSTSPWQTTSNVVNLVTAGDTVNVGGTGALAKLAVDGDADEIQLLVQGNGTQTALLAVFEDSAGNDQVTISNDGAVVINEEGNDADFRVESDGDANCLRIDASANRVGFGLAGPGAKVDILGNDVVNEYALQVTPAATRPNTKIQSSGGDPLLEILSSNIFQWNSANRSDADFKIDSQNINEFLSIDASSDVMAIGGTLAASAILNVASTSKGSVPSPVMTTAQIAAISSPAEGLQAYDGDTNILKQYDTQRWRNIDDIGWTPFAYPLLKLPNNATTGSTITLAADGGSVAIPILVQGHMRLESVTMWNRNTNLERTWGWDLYVQYLNNGNAGENTLTRVVASNGNETFTAAAASARTLAATADTDIGPGIYWLVVQCRHATNTFIQAGVASVEIDAALNSYQTKTTTNPNGATLDFVAATWTKGTAALAVRLNGVVFGQTTAF